MISCRFRGLPCEVRFRKMPHDGLCEKEPDRIVISLDTKLANGTEHNRLESYLHESLHACIWDFDEEAIGEMAHDIAVYLKRLGVKCPSKTLKKN